LPDSALHPSTDRAISPRTVEIHRARVVQKMQAQSLSELVRLALTAGLSPDVRKA
jgi:two-component system response regulator FixJ